MAELTAAARKKVSKSDTAVPSKRTKSGGAVSGSYPIPDIAHARNALARSSGKAVEAQVKAKVYAKYPQLRPSGGARAKAAMKKLSKMR